MAEDLYKYFRIEARELLDGLSQGVMDLEKGAPARELAGRLLRQAHTLKGASRIVKQPRIAELSHAIEELLAPHRDSDQPVPRGLLSQMMGVLDEIAGCLSSLEAPAQRSGAEPAAPSTHGAVPIDDGFQAVRVETREMDAFLHEIAEAAVYVSSLRDEAKGIDESLRLVANLSERAGQIHGERVSGADRLVAMADQLHGSLRRVQTALTVGVDRSERELRRARERAGELRLLPATTIFPLLERAVRDVAESLKRRIEFRAFGGENRLDAHVLRALRDALLHVVRNAAAHGIEPEADRVRAGKTPAGHIELHVTRRGNRIVFTCHDDGQGIDIDAVRRVAVEQGIASAAEAAGWDISKAVQVIFGGGISTTREITQVSGRGIGTDVLRETVARLKGRVVAHSEPSRGTTVEISVPVSLESIAVLEVAANDSVVGVPFDAIRRVLRVPLNEIVQSARGASVLFDGQAVPFVPLAQLLRPQQASARFAREAWSVIILQAASAWVALGVDRLLRQTSVVMRPMPPIIGKMPIAIGASFDSEGNPQLVLDPAGVADAAGQAGGAPPEPGAPAKAPVLVIDDSLTTRMLEQSILETAGYDVSVAVSGEEALQKAAESQYRLFVVDVEMPGMDGFEFVRRVQEDAKLRDVPCIMVTSRASPEDRLRGQRVGARAYIAKSEFDERHLLNTLKMLVG